MFLNMRVMVGVQPIKETDDAVVDIKKAFEEIRANQAADNQQAAEDQAAQNLERIRAELNKTERIEDEPPAAGDKPGA